jgi:hypothetical protein
LAILLNNDSVALMRFAVERSMMGQLNHDQGEFFYSFRLDEAIPDDHPARAIAACASAISVPRERHVPPGFRACRRSLHCGRLGWR